MSRLAAASTAAILMATQPASALDRNLIPDILLLERTAGQPISLLEIGWTNISGRLVERFSGWTVKQQFTFSGGLPAKVGPNGSFQVEPMYALFLDPTLPPRSGSEPNRSIYATVVDEREGWPYYFLRVSSSYASPGWHIFCFCGETSF
jgi:hypothetical protein